MLRVVIVTIGLLILLNGLAQLIWSGEVRAVESPFPSGTFRVGDVAIAYQDIGTICVSLGVVVLLWLFFQFTKVGLAMRAAAVNPARGTARRCPRDVDARRSAGGSRPCSARWPVRSPRRACSSTRR